MSALTLTCDFGNVDYNRDTNVLHRRVPTAIVAGAIFVTVAFSGINSIVALSPPTVQCSPDLNSCQGKPIISNDQAWYYNIEKSVNIGLEAVGVLTKQKVGSTEIEAYLSQPSAYSHILAEELQRRGTAVSRAKRTVALVYGSLTSLGLVAMGYALLVRFYKPLFDPNIAYVLLPVSLGFLGMIMIDFLLWGREHARS